MIVCPTRRASLGDPATVEVPSIIAGRTRFAPRQGGTRVAVRTRVDFRAVIIHR